MVGGVAALEHLDPLHTQVRGAGRRATRYRITPDPLVPTTGTQADGVLYRSGDALVPIGDPVVYRSGGPPIGRREDREGFEGRAGDGPAADAAVAARLADVQAIDPAAEYCPPTDHAGGFIVLSADFGGGILPNAHRVAAWLEDYAAREATR